MKLEILRGEIRIEPEGPADEVYLRSITNKGDRARARLIVGLDGKTVYHLLVEPFPYGEGPSVSS